MTLPESVSGWHDFYLMVGTAGATMVGLLFVALSLERNSIRGDSSGPSRMMASQAFLNFICVVLFAVFFLIPDQGRFGLGLPLLGTGVYGLMRTLRNLVPMWRHRREQSFSGAWGLLGGSAAAYLGLAGVAVSVLFGQTVGLYWLVPVMIVLIVEAARNAWVLLLGGQAS